MLEYPAVGDLGGFDSAVVVEVREDHTALVEVPKAIGSGGYSYGMPFIISGPLANSVKARQVIHSPTVWRVTETDARNTLGKQGRRPEKQLLSKVEPVNKADLEKYRAMYEEGKKQKAAPPAAIKDEKPELDKAPMPAKPKGNAAEK